MNKKLTITIGIAAYKAEENIKNILDALLKQKEKNIVIEKIYVFCDPSGDKTASVAKEMKAKKVIVVENKKRLGFAHSVKKIMEINKSDVLIELNDDILIKDALLIEKICAPFVHNTSIGFVSGNPQPLKPKNFMQKAIVSTFKAYESMRYNYRNGNNEFTCDGKILAFSKELIKKIKFPKKYSLVGNLDTYLYLSCLKSKLLYAHVRDAIVYYNVPNSIKEYIRSSTRNNTDYHLLLDQFGIVVKKEFKKPFLPFLYFSVVESLKNPFGCLFIFTLGIYIKHKSKSAKYFATETWDVIESTKERIKHLILA